MDATVRSLFGWIAMALSLALVSGCSEDVTESNLPPEPDVVSEDTGDTPEDVEPNPTDLGAWSDANDGGPILDGSTDSDASSTDLGDTNIVDGDTTDGGGRDAGDNADTYCEPRTCAEINKACGRFVDNCGGTITCRSSCDDFLALGGYHTCFFEQGGRLKCWGSNQYGQLGLGHTGPDVKSPTKTATNFVAPTGLTAGEDYTCVVDQGKAKCWGANYHGQTLGRLKDKDGDEITKVLQPTSPDVPGVGILSIEGHNSHTCAINDKQHMYCWGFNGYGGILSNNTSNQYILPKQFTLGNTATVRRMSVGALHQCAESGRGDLWCFGNGFFGSLGISSITIGSASYYAPVVLPNFSVNFRQVEAGGMDTKKGGDRASFRDDFSCAIDSSGAAKCWGSGYRGSLGNGPPPYAENTPQYVQELGGDVVDLALGGGHACAIETQSLYCWGNNQWGQLGLGDTEDRLVATEVPFPNTNSPLVNVEAGYMHTCAQLQNGELYCWGRNHNGQVGAGSRKRIFTRPQLIVP